MRKKIYRGLDYHKYRIGFFIGVVLSLFIMCTPRNNPVENEGEKSDTTEVLESDVDSAHVDTIK